MSSLRIAAYYKPKKKAALVIWEKHRGFTVRFIDEDGYEFTNQYTDLEGCYRAARRFVGRGYIKEVYRRRA